MSESLPVLVTANVASAVIVRLPGAGSDGALFTSVTTTVKLFVALNGGVPLSVTRVVIVLVPGPCTSLGVHAITPELEMVAPEGAASKVYVKVFGGESLSVAVFVTISVVNSATVASVCAGRIGAVFAGVTVTRKLFVALSGGEPLSVTTVVMVFVDNAWASEGAQVMTPFESITAPAGGKSN
jgi:hypothetical protein